ncbi:MAG: PDDEXK nuclease domain-containing protein [Bacteroidales bacterium]|nr:PDDEXK nuclease domain-containing protein [Bacteroidales bacterium]
MTDLIQYADWLKSVKLRIRQSQIKAAVKVNNELLRLYWSLGKEIVELQKSSQWGDSFLQKLSKDLATEFSDMKGFSYRNLKSIRQWYLFYSQYDAFGQQFVSQIAEGNGQQSVSLFEHIFFSVPWGHHLYIIQKCKEGAKAMFYLKKTVENGWSRAVLANFLDTNLYEREGKAITNFQQALPLAQSDLAEQTIKDPYNFDFLTLTKPFNEKELENALIDNVTKFLIELGKGFAYVGRQIHFDVGGETFMPDLLFYHLDLRCFVVIELKVTDFDPSYLGQLNFYVNMINHQMKKEVDAPTIGLLICKSKNDIIAKYALEGYSQPLGISQFEMSKMMPDNFKSSLPTIEEIESELSKI